MNEKNSYANETRLAVSRPPRNQFEIKSETRNTVENGEIQFTTHKAQGLKLTFKQIITNDDAVLLMCWCIRTECVL